jgi:hypothetical protein
VLRSLGLLVGGSLAFWLVVAYPAWLLGGSTALVFSAVAGLLCLVPTAATMLWCLRAALGAPEQQLLATMGGTVVRLVVVLGAGMALFHTLPYFHDRRFWLWVIVYYLLTLTLEVALVVARQAPANRSLDPEASARRENLS